MVNLGIGTFWLNGPAALSFKRMLLDGMPKEGLKSAGRTFEQQQYLYNGWIRRLPGFNLAAKPGTSLHEKGNAIDAERGSPMQTWLAKGGSLYKVNSGENLRAHEYGFYRTVPTEAWHFAYYPDKDKHLNDKTKDDEMPTPDDLWEYDKFKAPDDSTNKKDNPYWTPRAYLMSARNQARAAHEDAAAALALVRELAKKVLTEADMKNIEAAARKGAASAIDDKIDDATVNLNVNG